MSGSPPGTRRRRCVLVVDPASVGGNPVCSSLEALGYDVRVCSGWPQAVALAKAEALDAILADSTSGVDPSSELIQALEELELATPVLVVAATADPKLRRDAMDRGAVDLVMRNAPLKFLRDRLESAFERTARPAPRRILVVDDDPIVVKLLGMVLREKGYDVGTASGALDAWKALHARRFDIVVSDYAMKDHTGLDLLDNMRKQQLLLPFILLAARLTDEIIERARALGAADIILKSSDLAPLHAALEKALDPRGPNGT